MTLEEYIQTHRQQITAIGTAKGSGYIYAGRLTNITAETMQTLTGVDMRQRKVKNDYASFFGGRIILIEGRENGNADMPKTFESIPDYDDVPIIRYQEFAFALSALACRDMKKALIGIKLGYVTDANKRAIIRGRGFFESDSFPVISGGMSGKDIIKLIYREAESEYKKYEQDREEWLLENLSDDA